MAYGVSSCERRSGFKIPWSRQRGAPSVRSSSRSLLLQRQTLLKTGGSGPGSAALPRPLGRRAHEHLHSLGRCREDRAAQARPQDDLTDWEAARRYHECTG
jgi:hypothetical protein